MSDAQQTERQSDLAVMEANEYKQKRRLERILDAHDEVEDIASEAYELYASGQISNDGKNIILLQGVKRFIRECFNLLAAYDTELEDDEPNEYWDPQETLLGNLTFEHTDDIPFRGLRDVLEADRVYVEEWTETTSSRHGPDSEETHRREHTVPEEVSWNAYLLLKEFLDAEHDLEVQFEDLQDDLPTWGFEVVEDEDVPDTKDLAENE